MAEKPARKKYPLSCPVCRVVMVGEKSTPESDTFELHRCFNCGSIIYESGEVVDDDDQD